MTDKTEMPMSGEERLRNKRRKFWRYLGAVCIASLLLGLALGATTGMFEDNSLPIWVPAAIAVVSFFGLLWFTLDYYRRVDELELMDNLWAHLFGLNFGVYSFGLWWILADIGLFRGPTAIEAICLVIFPTFIAYFARKLGLR